MHKKRKGSSAHQEQQTPDFRTDLAKRCICLVTYFTGFMTRLCFAVDSLPKIKIGFSSVLELRSKNEVMEEIPAFTRIFDSMTQNKEGSSIRYHTWNILLIW